MTATQKKWLKWAILSLIVISLAALAYWYFKPKPQKSNYITANVERSDIENSVMSTGKIEGIKQVDVGAQVSGEVTKLYVEVGDTVKKGDVIAQIDPVTLQNTLTTQQATLQQSKANLESTKSAYQTKQAALATARADLKGKIATLQQSQTEYNRLKSLLAMNAISKQELEQADTAVKTAQANVDSAKEAIATAQANIASSQADIVSAQQTIKKAQTDVNTAEKNLGYSQIVAPMSGTVISITTKQGQTVNANQSAPTIVTLADLSSVRVKAKISEADVVNLKTGLPVYFNIIGRPDKKYQATLSTIGPAPDGTTASDSSTSTDSAIYYIGYFTVPNPDGALRINMTAQVYIVENKVSNVLSVPAAAIKTDPKMGSYVEVVQSDGTTKKQAVKTGVTNRITTQILSGVNQGDKVVVGQAAVSKSSSSSKNNGGPPMM
ncbi:MacA family efflux pump subunit [Streptomyces cinereus]|nr:MacA family efflux pump subunit [Streptomyces cinereus]